jgi:hypothetical protein
MDTLSADTSSALSAADSSTVDFEEPRSDEQEKQASAIEKIIIDLTITFEIFIFNLDYYCWPAITPT